MKNSFSLLLWAVASLISISGLRVGARPGLERSSRLNQDEEQIHLSDQPEIDAGFRLMYELKFPEARAAFMGWETRHPGEPLGVSAEAATYLFQEFDRHNVLTSDFFLNDSLLLGGIEGKTDPQLRNAFRSSAQRAEDLARIRLKSNPRDADALFALMIAQAMRGDYANLIERKQVESLRLIRVADATAKDLLALAPGITDAYVVLGSENYFLGCLPGYKRLVIRLGGFHGDRALGMRQLGIAAESGHYLRPYAKLVLGLTAMREKQWDLARTQFKQLTTEFPDNPKFARELAKLNATMGHAATP